MKDQPSAQRRLTAVLCADVVGYSRLMQADEQATHAALTSRRRLFGERVAAHGGRIVNAPGDSILAEFASVGAGGGGREKSSRSGRRQAIAALGLAGVLGAGFALAPQIPGWLPKPAGEAAATIAVLPFANQSGDAKREYFSDGITEDIINALGRFSEVRVTAPNAVQPYKGGSATTEEISRDLDVRYLVRGSVRQAEGRVRVNVELSDTAKRTQLWSERYDGEGKE